MLTAFRIKNFMSFRNDALFSLEPDPVIKYSSYDICECASVLKVAAVFGANASGKTTLLRALRALQRIVCIDYESTRIQDVIVPFAFKEDQTPTEFEILFSRGEKEYHYEISFSKGAVVEESLAIDGAQFFNRNYQRIDISPELDIFKVIAQPLLSCFLIQYFFANIVQLHN